MNPQEPSVPNKPDWYVIHLGQSPDEKRGPFSYDQLLDLKTNGAIQDTDMVMSITGTAGQWVGMAYLPKQPPTQNFPIEQPIAQPSEPEPVRPQPEEVPIKPVTHQHDVVAYQKPAAHNQSYTPSTGQHAQPATGYQTGQNQYHHPQTPADRYPHQPGPVTHSHVYVQTQQENVMGLIGFITALIGVMTGGVIMPISLIFCIIGLGSEPKQFAWAGLIINLVGLAIGLVMLLFFGGAILACCCAPLAAGTAAGA